VLEKAKFLALFLICLMFQKGQVNTFKTTVAVRVINSAYCKHKRFQFSGLNLNNVFLYNCERHSDMLLSLFYPERELKRERERRDKNFHQGEEGHPLEILFFNFRIYDFEENLWRSLPSCLVLLLTLYVRVDS
jgi:hypothetical protein